MIRTKRVYEPSAADDGVTILVDRLWPRGLSKEKAQVDPWLKDVTPSDELRRWFGRDPQKRAEFKRKYAGEPLGRTDFIEGIIEEARKKTATLLYAAGRD
jgi:uncharacterized protein YeaO (DUF488 family)